MPAHDLCEPQVVRALEKAGYEVTHRPYSIRLRQFGATPLFADLRLVSQLEPNRVIIIVEVKCFPDGDGLMSEFYSAVGQFMTYRDTLDEYEPDAVLYLAIPQNICATLISRPSTRKTSGSAQLKFIVVDMDAEEVMQWTD